MEEYKSITDKLHAYEKQWTDMDYTIGHLRQENAELKAEVVGLKNLYRPSISTSVDDLVDDVTGKTRIELQRSLVALEKCREALIGWRKYFQSDLPKTADQQECQGEQFTSAWFDAEEAIKSAESLSSPPNLQPTQDPATHRIIRACLAYLRNDNTRQLYFDACKVLGIEPEVWDTKPATDPSTAIAYGLYPSSARTVNPGIASPSMNEVIKDITGSQNLADKLAPPVNPKP